MFDTLLESRARAPRSWRQALVSVVVHGGVIFAAVAATRTVAETVYARPVERTMVYFPPAASAPSATAAPARTSAAAVSANPLPKNFPKIVPTIDIPRDIPSIDVGLKPFDLGSPSETGGRGSGAGLGKGIGDGRGGNGPGLGLGSGDGAYAESDLDDRVQIISIPEPRYPPALQSLGIEATVELRYIVDTTGRAERASIQAVNQARPEFIQAAKEAILRGAFKPARLRGHVVRQWVTQRARFQVR